MMRPALAMASLAVGASASIGSQAVGLPRGLQEGPPNLMDPQLLQDSCSRLANFTSSASPILAYGKTVQGWLNEPSCQIFVASAALIAGLCLTWDGPQLWKALFTLALACAAAFAARFEAEAWHLQIFSIFTVMCQAAVIVGTAVYWGFEGSQVLLGSCCGFAGAYGMGAWVLSQIALKTASASPTLGRYICGSVLGIQIFTAWRRGMLACLAPVLGGLLVSSAVGTLISRAGLRTPFLPKDTESWLTATEALLGLDGTSSLALFGLPVFVAATVNGFDDARRPLAVAILVAPIGFSVLAHVTCQDIKDTSLCPNWQVPSDGWRWPAVGCGLWLALTALTAWVQLEMLEQESEEEDAWHAYPWPLGRTRSWKRSRFEPLGH
ncbi:unnamed protein product [Durusdinium trenchii]|uniref:Uncharacterized protein n=1 Tax=Durusdinium trenchii TaxID=1381693 RepID=A0ABP0L1S5_9DINO